MTFYEKNFLSRKHPPPADKTRKFPWLLFVFSSFRAFVIDHVWFSALYGGSGLGFNKFEVQNKVPPIKNVFHGVASGGEE